ncbi:dTDP-4-dehydrorhamnose 3,5-epimerase [Synechococcus sp. HB1133]|uniref:dTDP-4-dehydrorhamnose 3,5-epimerase n=1 Tax=unclassified Synechococcus TaxID=2626047 RepID=UPI0014087FFE|nr:MULTISPECIES: dTDP-4-dehydrorhamnose 3,5-epimerase [unclassified Synechococcus]MCB4394219.1 dTDP-4-dehydrorhamnose 3,5-epimerase [Synechococcus sp. PH41509]MCB4423428.1 dTDP-4-dehydrorhamnose 3,5-epimerase [Synechococcus sp. HB1133]MCB4431461.1 dTDP-4-dehydrorhamnose 3,5-epimerase [Synechococcus sp. HBA1120]NHI82376.1 dTDP-4-dehydrorhamnose 3,5-epimerase [Synechococcus sp. HB1133]
MQFEQLKTSTGQTMEGPLLMTPRCFGDDRGWFFESWNRRSFDEAVGETVVFSQDNHSRSIQGVLRGLHYQLAPEPQAKLVRATVGAIYDIAVDIRRGSPTFGSWVGAELSAENKSQLWIPEGFAHGFLTLSSVAEVQYKARGFWNKSCERAIVWNDADLAIAWPIELLEGAEVSLSGKDAEASSFQAAARAGVVFP